MIVYDHHFNANEWFVIAALCVGVTLVLLLPTRFPLTVSLTFFMCGVYSGFFFDHSLSVEPVSFYDVNDSSKFEVTDFISYWTYGPVSYLYFYLWDTLKLRPRMMPIYILGWLFFAFVMERLGVHFGLYHYQHGYKIDYSLAIYALTFCCWFVLYYSYRCLRANGKPI